MWAWWGWGGGGGDMMAGINGWDAVGTGIVKLTTTG